MKLQLDLDNKIIRIEDKVNLAELYTILKRLFPQGEWKEFSIDAGNTIVWTNPYIIKEVPIYPTNPYPWWTNPIITYDLPTSYGISSGTYNIEITN